MELEGRIIAALPQRKGESARGEWVVQEFVLETIEAYPKKMVFSIFGSDRLSRFNVQIGQEVKVLFDIDAREYQGRWFNSIRAYDVQQKSSNTPSSQTQYTQSQDTPPPPFPPAQDNTEGGSVDDLPF